MNRCIKESVRVISLMERFLVEFRITKEVNSAMKQSEFDLKTCKRCQAREKVCRQGTIGLGFVNLYQNVVKQNKTKQNKTKANYFRQTLYSDQSQKRKHHNEPIKTSSKYMKSAPREGKRRVRGSHDCFWSWL